MDSIHQVKGVSTVKDVRLVSVICPECNVPITKTLPGAAVSCYRCGLWVKAGEDNSKGQNLTLERGDT